MQTYHFGYTSMLSGIMTLWMSVSALSQNLVPNPSFETVHTCPTNNIFTANDWYNPNTASPDNFHPCGTGSWTVPGPNVLFGPQLARTGSGFAGIGWYGLGGGWYDYIQVKLSSPMVVGETYKISMWVILAKGARHASDDLGIYISNAPFKSVSTIQPSILSVVPTTPVNFGVFTTLTPQIKCPDNNFITDVNNWTEISGTYLANGGESNITIGCFEPWATTGTSIVNPSGDNRCYYYIDDVSVEDISTLPLELISFHASENDHHEIELHWETSSEKNTCFYEIERSTNAQDFETLHTMNATGNSNTLIAYHYTDKNPWQGKNYYRLKTIDCDGKISYSKIINTEKNTTEILTYPNPVQEELTVLLTEHASYETTISLYNSVGTEMIHRTILNADKITIPFYDQVPGIYTLIVQSAQGTPVYKKIVKQ